VRASVDVHVDTIAFFPVTTIVQLDSLFCFFSGVTMTIDSSEDGSADDDDITGLRNTRSECSDIFSEHFISLRVDLSTLSTASSMRGATVQYSTWRSSASGSSPATGIDELFKCKKQTPIYLKKCNDSSNQYSHNEYTDPQTKVLRHSLDIVKYYNANQPLAHIHTHPFNGPLSRSTWVSQNQSGFTEARDSEWQWHQLGHMQVCTLIQTDNHASTPPFSFL